MTTKFEQSALAVHALLEKKPGDATTKRLNAALALEQTRALQSEVVTYALRLTKAATAALREVHDADDTNASAAALDAALKHLSQTHAGIDDAIEHARSAHRWAKQLDAVAARAEKERPHQVPASAPLRLVQPTLDARVVSTAGAGAGAGGAGPGAMQLVPWRSGKGVVWYPIEWVAATAGWPLKFVASRIQERSASHQGWERLDDMLWIPSTKERIELVAHGVLSPSKIEEASRLLSAAAVETLPGSFELAVLQLLWKGMHVAKPAKSSKGRVSVDPEETDSEGEEEEEDDLSVPRLVPGPIPVGYVGRKNADPTKPIRNWIVLRDVAAAAGIQTAGALRRIKREANLDDDDVWYAHSARGGGRVPRDVPRVTMLTPAGIATAFPDIDASCVPAEWTPIPPGAKRKEPPTDGDGGGKRPAMGDA